MAAFPTPSDKDWERERKISLARVHLQFASTPNKRLSAIEELERELGSRSPEILAYMKKHPEAE